MIFFIRCDVSLPRWVGAVRAERTAGGIRVILRPHTARLRRLCGVTKMWHLRCHDAYDSTQREKDNAFDY